MGANSLIPSERIQGLILLIRGHKVILDSDLADLYAVETGVLNQAVRRNVERFPEDFMFQLTEEEHSALRSHSGISKGHGGRRHPPYAFTEQGVAMLSSVLRSPRAVRVNIEIMRAFVRLRRLLASHEHLHQRLSQLETQYAQHDQQIRVVFEVIRQLMAPPEEAEPGEQIGFHVKEAPSRYKTRRKSPKKTAAKKRKA